MKKGKQITRKESKNDIFCKMGVFASTLLVSASAVYMYSPTIGTHAAESATPTVRTNVGAVISLSANTNKVEMNANINSFVHDAVNLTVTTNSQYGYTLTIEDIDSNTNMTHEDSDITDVITSTFSGSKTSSTMDNNTWGYSVDNGANYYHVPEFGSPVRVDDYYGVVPNGSATKAIDFGVKLGVVTSGVYDDTVLFTAYTNGTGGVPENGTGGNPRRGATVNGTMQSFNCETAEAGATFYLKDTRDNNVYRVVKAADGNCWMTDNLRISNHSLTSDDTDILYDYSISKSIKLDDLGRLLEITRDANPSATDAEILDIFSPQAIYIDNTYGGYYGALTAVGGASNGAGGLSDDRTHTSICPNNWRLPSETDVEGLGLAYDYDMSKITGEPMHLQYTGGYYANKVNDTYVLVPNGIGEISNYLLSNVETVEGVPASMLLRVSDDSQAYEHVTGNELVTVRCMIDGVR